jgi:hypothetical protein
LEQFHETTKVNRFLSTNRKFNSPYERKIDETLPLNEKMMKTATIHESEKYINFIYSNDSKLKYAEEKQL